jgi:hypothetical protein
MVRSLILVAFSLFRAVIRASFAFAEAVRERLVEIWPIAFPTAPPGHPRVGGWPTYQDAKPVARRFREYRARVMARVAFTPALRPVAA